MGSGQERAPGSPGIIRVFGRKKAEVEEGISVGQESASDSEAGLLPSAADSEFGEELMSAPTKRRVVFRSEHSTETAVQTSPQDHGVNFSLENTRDDEAPALPVYDGEEAVADPPLDVNSDDPASLSPSNPATSPEQVVKAVWIDGRLSLEVVEPDQIEQSFAAAADVVSVDPIPAPSKAPVVEDVDEEPPLPNPLDWEPTDELLALLRDKVDEFRLLGYGHATTDELWRYFKGLKKRRPTNLHELVNAVLSLQPQAYMNFVMQQAYRTEPLRSLGEEDLKELL